MEEAGTKNNQLCWSCRRSYLGLGCPWAERCEPVPGWVAQMVTCGRTAQGPIETYSITGCPLYKNDAPDGPTRRLEPTSYHAKAVEDNAGADDLKAAIIKQACTDYMDAYKVHIIRDKAKYFRPKYDEYIKHRGEHKRTRDYKANTFEDFLEERTRNIKKTITECEAFFRSDYFKMLTTLDGERLIKDLRIQARR